MRAAATAKVALAPASSGRARTVGSAAVLPFAFGVSAFGWQFVFFAAPLAFLIVVTFWQVRSFRLEPAFILDNWARILGSGTFYSALLHTLVIAATATALTLLLALPAAYTLSYRLRPRLRDWAVALLVVPVFSSYILRIYAWQIVLSPQGLVNSMLGLLGVDALPLLGGALSLQVGFLTLTLPVALLILTFAMSGIDPSLIEAAENLGAARHQVVAHVVLPAVRAAIAVTATTAFLLAFGDYVSPLFMTGSRPPTLSILVVDTVKSGSQWPRASVIGVIMLAILGVVFGMSTLLSMRRRAAAKRRA